MKLTRLPILASLLGLALAACGTPSLAVRNVPDLNTPTLQPSAPSVATPARSDDQGAVTVVATPPDSNVQPPLSPEAVPAQGLARTDSQGAVTVIVTPLNLSAPGETLDFDVAMNTHSVDLGMDLAALAVLTTDTGRTVQATGWDGPQGGHHVAGKLTFPVSVGDIRVLEGAGTLTLTLRDVQVPERIFVWEIAGQ